MKRRVFVLLGASLLAGCALTMSSIGREPITRTAQFPQMPALIYDQARTALAAMGTQITVSDGRQLSGVLKGVVVLNIEVAAAGTGSMVIATGQLLPGKIVAGELDEVDTFMAQLQRRVVSVR